jgi:hypothetical protein
MQTRHDPLPCGVSALLLNPDRPKQKARLGGVFRAPQKRQTRFSKPSTGTLNLIWSLKRIDRGRKKPVYAMIQPAHTGLKQWGTSASLTLGHGRRHSVSRIFELGSGGIVRQTEKELLLNLSAYGMIP